LGKAPCGFADPQKPPRDKIGLAILERFFGTLSLETLLLESEESRS
jgi:hypothetical protein